MRPIDADRVTENLQSFVDWCRDGRRQGAEFCLDCVIPNTPTIDAVPVIRCKDCKWYEFDEPHRCGFGGHGVRGKSDYCSDAERKEDDTY